MKLLFEHAKPDAEIWAHARKHDFLIVSKDDDFRQLSLLRGAPPKVVQLSVGNAGTDVIARLLSDSAPKIETFAAEPEEALLILRLH